MAYRLTKNDLRIVRNGVLSVSSKWYDLGLELGISPDHLDAIRKGNDDPQDCLREVLKRWLADVEPAPTWRTVIIALRNPAVGHHSLAEELEQKYCTKVETNHQNSATCNNQAMALSKVTQQCTQTPTTGAIFRTSACHSVSSAHIHNGASQKKVLRLIFTMIKPSLLAPNLKLLSV